MARIMNIILGLTGSVATILAPKLVDRLLSAKHSVNIVATTPALYFMDMKNFSSKYVEVFKDKDEWPEGGYHKKDTIRHIEFRTWADLLLIAPITANTLAKIANGICDNFLCCIVRAWPKNKPIILAPAMNTEMWNNPITQAHINNFSNLFLTSSKPGPFNEYSMVDIIPPISKKLACGEEGIGAMADIKTILEYVERRSL